MVVKTLEQGRTYEVPDADATTAPKNENVLEILNNKNFMDEMVVAAKQLEEACAPGSLEELDELVDQVSQSMIQEGLSGLTQGQIEGIRRFYTIHESRTQSGNPEFDKQKYIQYPLFKVFENAALGDDEAGTQERKSRIQTALQQKFSITVSEADLNTLISIHEKYADGDKKQKIFDFGEKERTQILRDIEQHTQLSYEQASHLCNLGLEGKSGFDMRQFWLRGRIGDFSHVLKAGWGLFSKAGLGYLSIKLGNLFQYLAQTGAGGVREIREDISPVVGKLANVAYDAIRLLEDKKMAGVYKIFTGKELPPSKNVEYMEQDIIDIGNSTKGVEGIILDDMTWNLMNVLGYVGIILALLHLIRLYKQATDRGADWSKSLRKTARITAIVSLLLTAGAGYVAEKYFKTPDLALETMKEIKAEGENIMSE